VVLSDYGTVDTTWHYFMIPLKEFNSQGNWWDEMKKVEVPGDVAWDRLTEICFSADKYGNRLVDSVPVSVYVDEITFIDKVPGYVDPDDYWNAFTSDAHDRMLLDFEEPVHAAWMPIAGEESEIFAAVIDQEDRSLRDTYGLKMLEVTYDIGDWGYVDYSFEKNSADSLSRDWKRHWALRFDVYTEKTQEVIKVQVNDSWKEAFFANITCVRGWNDVLLPIRMFKKYPYYQEPDAELNNAFDLGHIRNISFWPTVAGSVGTFRVDNVRLTNSRTVK
jgi:hypothetical protein